ncbi:MAG TPA: hypothetical protein VEJ42_02680 [Streptosporangiaceae bacterium]|nr:hypothetical protein [Streptosporangiaceae bacterium]
MLVSDVEEDRAMKQTQQDATLQLNSRLLLSGVVLAGLGSLVGLAGLALSAAALADIARQWVNQQEVPPAELARQQVAKAKAATAAGASTWRSHPANSAAHRH